MCPGCRRQPDPHAVHSARRPQNRDRRAPRRRAEDPPGGAARIIEESPLFDLHRFCCKKYGPPKLGTSRVTYLSKHVVFKVPINDDGFRNNDCWEASLLSIGEDENDPNYMPLAYSRFLPDATFLWWLWKKVSEATEDEIIAKFGAIPAFVHNVDMGQVGWTKKRQTGCF